MDPRFLGLLGMIDRRLEALTKAVDRLTESIIEHDMPEKPPGGVRGKYAEKPCCSHHDEPMHDVLGCVKHG